MTHKRKAAPGESRRGLGNTTDNGNDSTAPAIYSSGDCMKDVFGLLSVTDSSELLPHECSFCNADTRQLGGFDSSNGHYAIARICPACHANEDGPGEFGKHIRIPDNDAGRLRLFRIAATLFALQAQAEGLLPVAIRTPKEHGRQQPFALLVFTKRKKLESAVVPFPWYDDDPQFMAGKMARDTLALHESIAAGETSYTACGGSLILETTTSDLPRKWGAV